MNQRNSIQEPPKEFEVAGFDGQKVESSYIGLFDGQDQDQFGTSAEVTGSQIIRVAGGRKESSFSLVKAALALGLFGVAGYLFLERYFPELLNIDKTQKKEEVAKVEEPTTDYFDFLGDYLPMEGIKLFLAETFPDYFVFEKPLDLTPPPPKKLKTKKEEIVVEKTQPETKKLGKKIEKDETTIVLKKANNGSLFDPFGQENTYMVLPNKLEEPIIPLRRTWSVEEATKWRAGIKDQYWYQQYKTVLDVKKERLKGSEVILWEALDKKKLWIRMHALIGLADFGYKVTVNDVKKAIGNTHRDPIDNFFRRFIPKNHHLNAAERYVLRQSLKIVDQRTRLTILRALNKSNDEMTHLYLAVASFDPDPKIQSWLEGAFADHHITHIELDKNRAKLADFQNKFDIATLDQSVRGAEVPPVSYSQQEKEAEPVAEYKDDGSTVVKFHGSYIDDRYDDMRDNNYIPEITLPVPMPVSE